MPEQPAIRDVTKVFASGLWVAIPILFIAFVLALFAGDPGLKQVRRDANVEMSRVMRAERDLATRYGRYQKARREGTGLQAGGEPPSGLSEPYGILI